MEEYLMQVSIALLIAALGAQFALITYFRQREYELILARYLEGGLDHLCVEVATAHEAFLHNWARCLAVLKSFRDRGHGFDVAELDKGFMPIRAANANIVAHHRLWTLTDTFVYWTYYQHAMAFFTSANSMLVTEIPEALRAKAATSELEHASHENIVAHAFEEARKLEEQGRNFVQLVSELQQLAAELEKTKYRFSTLKRFRSRPMVADSIARAQAMVTAYEAESEVAQQVHTADARTSRD